MNIKTVSCIYLKYNILQFTFEFRKSMHHHMIQINQPTRRNSFTSLLLDVYLWLNMFWAPLCPSSRVYNCTRSLWFYRWSVAVGALLVVVSDHVQRMFMCASTCFGSLSAHHQERTTALGASGFTIGVWRLERCWSWSKTMINNAPTAMLQR